MMERYDKAFFNRLLGQQSEYYFAHLPKEGQMGRTPELLSEHSALTMAYAQSLAEANGLDSIIERLVNDSIPPRLTNRRVLAETIKKWFWRAIAFHDLGKINHKFQYNRMKNFARPLQHVDHHFDSQHSIISAYLYLASFFSEFISMELSDEEQIFLSNVVLYMSGPIKQHHSPFIDSCQSEEIWCEYKDKEIVVRPDIEALKPYIHCLNLSMNDDEIESFHENYLGNSNTNALFCWFNETVFEQKLGFPLFLLVKLLYSLLTASDYLATAHYMNNWRNMLQDYGLITEELRKRIISNAHTTKTYNKQTYSDLELGKFINPDDYMERNGHNMNLLRESLAMEVVINTRRNWKERLFYIEAPTGSGKTNASMLAVSELLEHNSTIQKIFYVFPFTTLITQTARSMKETLGLRDDELMEYHSKATKNSGKYEYDYQNYLESMFLNIPIVLLSHITFFDVLKSNGKDYNYLLQRMAHSVVVIDEIQSYSPAIWDKIAYFISNYSEYFDMRFIVMSATLPKIGKLIEDKKIADKFVYLVDDKNKYFLNPNFCNRVVFDYTLLGQGKPEKDDLMAFLTHLCAFISNKSKEYADYNSDNPYSVLTVCEFIFKKTASQFYGIAKESDTCFDEIMLLSGTILEPRRRQIIEALKSAEYRKRKVLLVTTQVVEAGVDIDVDLGFKDKSLIDSEEQLAGRINRNANKKACKLYLFDCNAEKILYSGDDRYQFTNEMSTNDYQAILSTKNFDLLYQKVIDQINKKNKSKAVINMQDFHQDIARLNYEAIDRSFEIIRNKNMTVFVPLSIDINLIDSTFIPIMDELGILHDETIYGWDVWEKYKEAITSPKDDFLSNRIRINKTRTLLSQFVFSIYPESNEMAIFKTFGKEEYGYFVLESYPSIYSFENGIETGLFHESNFL